MLISGRSKLIATEIREAIDTWLIEKNVRQYVPDHLVENYSMALARYIQTEDEVSKTGFLAKHPTTGAPITSPYVTMSLEYQKQVQQIWWQIYQMIKDATAKTQEKPTVMQNPVNSLIGLLQQKKEA